MWNELKSKVNCRLNESELHNCGAGCSRLKCSQQHSGRAQGDKTSPLNQNLIIALWSDKCRPTDHFSLLLRKLPNRNQLELTLKLVHIGFSKNIILQCSKLEVKAYLAFIKNRKILYYSFLNTYKVKIHDTHLINLYNCMHWSNEYHDAHSFTKITNML